MIKYVELKTFENKYFRLDLYRTKRNTTGTYKLIRYELPDNSTTWNAVANNWVMVYMSEYEHMGPDSYMGGIDLEEVATDKVVTDVSDTLRFYDTVIDNTDIDPDKVYAYTLVVIESNVKYRTPYVTGYIESEIESYSKPIRPATIVDWLKHRGVADISILNLHLKNAYYDLMYYERKYNALVETYKTIAGKIKVSDLLDKLEKIISITEMIKKSTPPTRRVVVTRDWGQAEWGAGSIWGLADLVIELGFPYNFGG